MDIVVTFQLTQREARQMARHMPKSWSRYVLFPVVTLTIGLFYFVIGGSAGVLAMFVTIGLGLPLLWELKLRGSIKRSASILASEWTVHLTDTFCGLRTGLSQAEVSWDAYTEVTEKAGFWYLRQTNGVTSFLPQRAFDPAQGAQLAAFFAARLPARKRPWYSPL